MIITWLAYSCRNRMLRHCPTDDRITGGKKKGEWPLFLWEFKLLWSILCSSQSMCDIGNTKFCGQQPNNALTSAPLQGNTTKCRACHFSHRINAPTELSKIVIKIRNAYVWHIFDFWLQIYVSLCCSESSLDQIIQIFKVRSRNSCAFGSEGMYAIMPDWQLMLSVNSRFWKFDFSSYNSFKNGVSLNLPVRGWCHDHNSQSSRFFLSFPSENRRPAKRKSVLESPEIQKFKCTCSAILKG